MKNIMLTFISKIQYDYFEDGEFIDIMESNAECVLKRVDNFNWSGYRNLYELNLTCPSVTIEHPDTSYLKIGIYFYGQYILYYLSASKKLFHKIVDTLEEVKQFTASYLDGSFQPDLFIRYWEIEWRPERFFRTKEFYYSVHWKRNIWILLVPLFFFVQFVLISYPVLKNSENAIFLFSFLLVFFVLFSGISFYLFITYYFFTRKLALKLSRGSDEFYYGEKNNLRKYNKTDINRIIDWGYHAPGMRGPIWCNFHVYQIEMKNSEILKFTSLLISDIRLSYKLVEYPTKDIHRFIPSLKSTKKST